MAEVARGAGVSRQSVYNEFGSRPVLAQAYVLWEAERFLAEVERAVSENLQDPVTALTAAFTAFLDAARAHPLVRELVAGEGAAEFLPLVTTQGGALHEQATAALAALLVENFPALAEDDAAVLADAVVRLAISHATLPGGSSRATGRAVGGLLGPFVERALG